MTIGGLIFWMFSGISVATLLHWLYHLLCAPRNLPPGPLPLPLIGNANLFMFRQVPEVLEDLRKKYGNVVVLYIGHSLRTVVFLGYHPMASLFTDHSTSEIFAGRPEAHTEARGVCRGVIWASWPEAKNPRRFVLRAFKEHGLGVSRMGEHVYLELESFVSYIDSQAGQQVDIGNLLTTHLASCVMQTIFSQRLELAQTRSAVLYKYGKKTGEKAHGFVYISAEKQMEQEMADWLKPELEKRRENFNPAYCVDFIDAYLAAESRGNAMPFHTFNRTLVDLFIGGMETVSETMNWAIFYLAHMPDEQERLFLEMEPFGRVELQDRSKLVRLEAFFNEVHRHSSRIEVLFLRATTEAVTVPTEDVNFEIPTNTAIMFSQIPSNMDVEYWLDPENFRVDRWLAPGSNEIIRHKNFLPFGLGKRSCIGEQPARGLMFLFMTVLIQKFSWKLADRTLTLKDCERGINRNAPRNYKLIFTPRL